ncbi:class I SAM-dependent methyltransferase [Microbacterium sp. TWP3-1-2b2]|uniref:class I SAM-dependent methyltransferase n=1 Tax=Microbacterium sp. TWP3-1-2b2 TaxID=2804651 RepID=UPI003CED60FB
MSDSANFAQQQRYRREPMDSCEIDVVPRDPGDAAIAAAYDARAAEYIEIAGSIDQMDAADRSLIGQWRDSTPGNLLDAGCGPGLWTVFLHDGHREEGHREEGHREVAGLDISAEFLVSARRRLPHLRFEQGSFRALPFDDASLGGILAWYSLIHTPPEEVPVILTEFARVLGLPEAHS